MLRTWKERYEEEKLERAKARARKDRAEQALGKRDTAKLLKLRALYAEGGKVRSRFAKFGAIDTEPRGVFNQVCADALNGSKKVPTSVDGWQLYSDMRGNGAAAQALRKVATQMANTILTASDKTLQVWVAEHDFYDVPWHLQRLM